MRPLLLCHQVHSLRLLLELEQDGAAEWPRPVTNSAGNNTAGPCISGGSVQSKQQAWLHECDCQSDPEKCLCTHGLVHFSSTQGK